MKNLIYIIFPVILIFGCHHATRQLVDIRIDVDRDTFNPVLEPGVTGTISIEGIYSDGKIERLNDENIGIGAKTRVASGNVKVISIEGNKLIPGEGGVGIIEAVVIRDGKTFRAERSLVVRPFYREYHQTLVLKLFMGMEGEPVERIAKDPLFIKPHDVLCTFEEALEVIRKTDNLTRGIPKIIYLVGWQKGGHDHLYPAWNEVNPRLKREQDSTALASLRWLILQSVKYNTTVSLHINMLDAYTHSPLWDEYVKKDLLAKDVQGQLLSSGIGIKGNEMYNVVYPLEWKAGLGQRRIDELIGLVPELKEGHTIQVDVFIAQRDNGAPISPWHARPENGGLTPDKYVETQREIFKYWREKGFDVTGEGILWAHPKGEGFYGLQPFAWWYPNDFSLQMQVPEKLTARGRTNRENYGDYRFTSSMHGEEIYIKDKETLPDFLGMFCQTTLPWYYLSQHDREAFANGVLYYSEGIKAGEENGKKIIRKGEYVLREDNNLFVEAKWKEKEIIAYTETGYDDKRWKMPADWDNIKSVDIYKITLEGPEKLLSNVRIENNELTISLDKNMAVSILPSGSDQK